MVAVAASDQTVSKYRNAVSAKQGQFRPENGLFLTAGGTLHGSISRGQKQTEPVFPMRGRPARLFLPKGNHLSFGLSLSAGLSFGGSEDFFSTMSALVLPMTDMTALTSSALALFFSRAFCRWPAAASN